MAQGLSEIFRLLWNPEWSGMIKESAKAKSGIHQEAPQGVESDFPL